MPSKTTREGFSNRDALSRTGMIYGTAGTDAQGQTDTWYDLDTFLQDQVHEVLEKLDEGSLDDEIWGKIVIMEKGKRVAKAYLRKTTVIIDGSTDNFDGKTLGFNAFDNPSRDEHTEEIKNKIGDGVILKMDYQGNIKGMARGMSPVICQGWKENEKKYNCVSDRLTKLQGRLNCSEEGKTFKIFDMKRFKSALERELSEGRPDAKTLMLKTAVRVALVKDGGEIVRTPCWFTIVNLVALDMLKSKIPNIRTLAARDYSNIFQSLACQQPIYSTSNYSSKDHYAASPINPEVLNAQALTQILAAAVKQANNNQPLSQSLNNLPVSVDQLAQLASTLSMVKTEAPPSKQEFKERDQLKKDRRRSCKIPSDDSSGEDSAMRSDSTQSGTRTRNKRWDQTTKSMDVIHQVPKKKSPETQRRGLHRPRLQDVLFDRSYSTTSDYDSNREVFDSGSWSSHGSQSYQERSSSSYIVSDAETAKLKAKTKGPPPPTPAKPTKKGSRRLLATPVKNASEKATLLNNEGSIRSQQRTKKSTPRTPSFVGELRRVLLKRNSFKDMQQPPPSPTENRQTSRTAEGKQQNHNNTQMCQQQSHSLPRQETTHIQVRQYGAGCSERGTVSYAEDKRRGLRRVQPVNYSTGSQRPASSASKSADPRQHSPHTAQWATGKYAAVPQRALHHSNTINTVRVAQYHPCQERHPGSLREVSRTTSLPWSGHQAWQPTPVNRAHM